MTRQQRSQNVGSRWRASSKLISTNTDLLRLGNSQNLKSATERVTRDGLSWLTLVNMPDVPVADTELSKKATLPYSLRFMALDDLHSKKKASLDFEKKVQYRNTDAGSDIELLVTRSCIQHKLEYEYMQLYSRHSHMHSRTADAGFFLPQAQRDAQYDAEW